jgi:hypothetical protein
MEQAVKLRDRLAHLSAERAALMQRIGNLPPRSQARTVANHRLTIITAEVLNTEAKLNRKAHNEQRP